jgi:hypothetical protein
MRGLNEPVPVPDIFCSGIGAIERLEGDVVRLWFYVSQASDDIGERDKIVVAKILAPASSIPDAILKLLDATIDSGSGSSSPPLAVDQAN